MFQKAYDKKQRMIDYYTEQKGDVFKLNKDNYYNQSISDIVKKVFEQPTLIQLKGHKSPALFVSILLHGNEFSGLEIMQKIFKKYQTEDSEFDFSEAGPQIGS